MKGTVSKVLSGGEGQKDEEKGGPLSFLSSLGEKKDDDSSSGGGESITADTEKFNNLLSAASEQ